MHPARSPLRPTRRRVALGVAAVAIAAPALALAADPGPGQVTTVGGPTGLQEPRGVLFTSTQTLVAERIGHRILMLGANGSLTRVAGTGTAGFSGDGEPAKDARLDQPTDLAPTADGGYLIADQGNHRVRKVLPNGRISTVAGDPSMAAPPPPDPTAPPPDPTAPPSEATPTKWVGGYGGDGGEATSAKLNTPRGVTVMPDGSFLIADENNHRIRRVGTNGIITTVAGTGTAGSSGDGGPATSARINRPLSVEPTPDGGYLIVERDAHRVRKVTAGGTISTVAGTTDGFSGDGGQATSAKLDTPRDAAPTADGGFFVADTDNGRVRRVAPDGVITTVAGTGALASSGDGGQATDATFNRSYGIELTPAGDLYVAESAGRRIRLIASPLPQIAGLEPASAPANHAAGTVSVTGTGFPATAVVLWNGSVLPTTRVSGTRLDAQVPAAQLTSAGAAQVAVRASAAGGDTTSGLGFTVTPSTLPQGTTTFSSAPAPRPTTRPRPRQVARPQLGLPRLRALNRPRAGGLLRLSASSSLSGNGARLVLQQRVGTRWVALRATALRGRTLPLRVRVPRAGRFVLRVRLQVGVRARVSRKVTATVLPRRVVRVPGTSAQR